MHRGREQLAEVPSDQANDGRLPNFVIIGAAKAGTTSLWQQLSQHPEIYMHPEKRLEFFSFQPGAAYAGPPPLNTTRKQATTLESYCRCFAKATNQIAIGEASNVYLYSDCAADRMFETLPSAKIIAILRNPAERAYSRYLQLRRSGREVETEFASALQKEEWRQRNNWWPEFHYVAGGLYYRQLYRYYRHYPRDQIRVYLFENIVLDMPNLLRDIFAFLGVNQNFEPAVQVVYGASGLQKNRLLHNGLQVLRAARPYVAPYLPEKHRRLVLRAAAWLHNKNLGKPPLSARDRGFMIERFKGDTLRLQELLNVDLTHWLQDKPA